MESGGNTLQASHMPLSTTGLNSPQRSSFGSDVMDTKTGVFLAHDEDDIPGTVRQRAEGILNRQIYGNMSKDCRSGELGGSEGREGDGMLLDKGEQQQGDINAENRFTQQHQQSFNMDGSDNDHDHYNDHDTSGAEAGNEKEGKLASPARKRRKDVVAKEAPPSVGEGASEADKAKASRDRNREHARNTRMRKKQYVENLKLQIGEMLQAKAREERDTVLNSSREEAARLAQRQMVLNMFFLKATEDLSLESWSSVIDNDFVCVTPVTPFRSFLPSEVKDFRRVIKGVDGMIQDTASLAVFMQSISPRSRNPAGNHVKFQFYTSPDDTVVGPNSLMSRWLMKTENAIECGAQCEVFSHGMLKAQFSSDNRIKRLELEFDVMSFMQQLQRALGGGEFRVIPNTLEAAIQPSRHARVICSAEHPYWITNVNCAWSCLMGHTEQEAKLFTLSLLDGPPEAKNGSELDAFLHNCMGQSPKRAGRAELNVIARDMRRLRAMLQLYPLGTTEGTITHFVVIMEEVPLCAGLPQAGMDLFQYV